MFYFMFICRMRVILDLPQRDWKHSTKEHLYCFCIPFCYYYPLSITEVIILFLYKELEHPQVWCLQCFLEQPPLEIWITFTVYLCVVLICPFHPTASGVLESWVHGGKGKRKGVIPYTMWESVLIVRFRKLRATWEMGPRHVCRGLYWL